MFLYQRICCFLLLLLIFATRAFSQKALSPDFYTGKQVFAQGYYDSAATYLHKALLAGDSLQREVLSLYGEALSLSGKLPEATSIIEKMKQVAEDSLAVDDQARALWLLGDVKLRAGQLQEALDTYQQALHTYGSKTEDTVTALIFRKIGFALFSMGQYGEAKKYAQQSYALMAAVLPKNRQDWADYYKLLGAIYDRQAQYDSALYYYEKSLDIQISVHGEHHPETAKLLVNLANVYHVRGANVKASRYFDQALHMMEEFLGKDNIIVAIIYNNMGIIDFDMGNFEKAIVYYQHALNTYRQKLGGESLQVAQIQNNISSAYLEMKNPQKALEFATQSLKIRKKQLDANNMMLAPVYVNLAGAYILLHNFARANYYSNRALHIYTAHGETYHPGMAESYTGLGESYLSQQQFQKALSFLYKAKDVSLHLYGPHHAKMALVENLLGKTFQQSHQLDSALAHYNLAIEAVLPGVHPDQVKSFPAVTQNPYVAQHFLFDALKGKAETLYLQYQEQPHANDAALLAAYAMYNYLSKVIDDMRNAYQREESKLFLSKIATPVYARALDVTWELYQQTHDRKYAEQAFSFSEKSKYALLSDFMNDVAARYSAGIPQEVLEKEQNLKSQITYYEKQIFEAPNDSVKAQYEPQLTELKKGYLDFVYQLEKGYPQYYRLKYNPKTAAVDEVRQVLGKDEQLEEYALAEDALYIFSIRQDSLGFSKIKMEEPLEQTVMQMRQGLADQDFALYTQNAWKLYHLLAAGWQNTKNKVIVIPAGVLGYVPFEVLLTKKVTGKIPNYWQLPYLIKDYIISYNYSATLYLSELNKRKSMAFQSFMVGFAPEFPSDTQMLAEADTSQVERGGLLNLKGAQRELKKIAEIFQGKFFFGEEATEANFKKAVENSRLIHLSTHGILDDEHPDMSYLAFSTTKDTTEDNLLHTYEIYNLKLKAELVTLSACNTGAGQLREGEGVMSMARGFAYAGCPNVVTSLWPASDYATAQLMQRFYYYLSNGWEKDQALHQAKLDFLADADENLANPYYWGSFILVGDAQPLQMVRHKWLIWVLSLSAVLGLAWMFYRKKLM